MCAGLIGLLSLAMDGLNVLHGRKVCTTQVICAACWSSPSGTCPGVALGSGGRFNKSSPRNLKTIMSSIVTINNVINMGIYYLNIQKQDHGIEWKMYIQGLSRFIINDKIKL